MTSASIWWRWSRYRWTVDRLSLWPQLLYSVRKSAFIAERAALCTGEKGANRRFILRRLYDVVAAVFRHFLFFLWCVFKQKKKKLHSSLSLILRRDKKKMLDRLPKWSQICSFARWFFFLKKIYLSFRSAFKYFLLLGERLGVKYYLPCANASLALSLYRCYGGAIQRSRELNIKNELKNERESDCTASKNLLSPTPDSFCFSCCCCLSVIDLGTIFFVSLRFDPLPFQLLFFA